MRKMGMQDGFLQFKMDAIEYRNGVWGFFAD